MRLLVATLFTFVALILQVSAANAQTPQERAGELVQWREYCSDPDPDLRLAYIERAISKGDIAIQRICTRSALESDNSDIRNLGLRAAIASVKQITFTVEMPDELKNQLTKAGNDKESIGEIHNSILYKIYSKLKNGFTVTITDAAVTSPSSVWYPLVGLPKKVEEYSGTAVIEGDKIIWTGKVNMFYGHWEGTINVSLESGGKLEGFYDPSDSALFPIAANLW